MSNSQKSRRVPSNSQTGCIDSARMALLKKLAAVNLFPPNYNMSVQTPQKSQDPPQYSHTNSHSHDESQRSNSLFDLLNKQLSQVSNNTYNMPRQIKSLFSANDSNFPPYKQFTATVETDILRREDNTSKMSLKESIYQKLLRGKSKSKSKQKQKQRQKERDQLKRKKVDDMIKQATFRPQKGTLKSISKQVFKLQQPPFKLKNQTPKQNNFKIKSTLQTQQTPRSLTRYEELLKYSNLVSKQNQMYKQNIDLSNNDADLSILPVTTGFGREIPESEVVKLNLKKSLEMKQRFFENYCSVAAPVEKIGMLDLNFEERQKQCIRSRSLKIIKNDIEKLKSEMEGCTFRPKLTPYRREERKEGLQVEKRYGDMKKSLNKPLVHYR